MLLLGITALVLIDAAAPAPAIVVNDVANNAAVDAGTLATIQNVLVQSVQNHAASAPVLAARERKDAAGNDVVIQGDVGKLGAAFVVSLSASQSGQVLARQQLMAKAFDESFPAQLDAAVAALLAPVAADKRAPAPTPEPTPDAAPPAKGTATAPPTDAKPEGEESAGGIIDVFAIDFRRSAFVGASGNIDVFAPLGDHLNVGLGGRLSWALFELGARVDFDTASSPDTVNPWLGGYVGLQGIQLPKGDFGLLRPSVGVDVLGSVVGHGGLVAGPYVANTFAVAIDGKDAVLMRLSYRYALLKVATVALPDHQIGFEISVNVFELVK